jgi:hypothetical protein
VKVVKVCSGGSTVLAAVVIVVKHRACLLVGRWYMAVRCQYRVGSVGRLAWSLVIGLVYRRIGAIVVRFR